MARIMATARDVLKDCLPIKCIEAVFLGLYLTSGWEGLDRIPLAFKSRAAGVSYRHIVLAVYDRAGHKFGALGMSRCAAAAGSRGRAADLPIQARCRLALSCRRVSLCHHKATRR